jgi:hypothetical protein
MAGDDKPADDGGKPEAGLNREGSSGRNRNRGNRRGNRINAANVPRAEPLFEGRIEALKGHIYDCSDLRQADMYTKTTREISGYVGRDFKGGDDIRRAVDSLAMPVINPPNKPDPATADKYDDAIWTGEMKLYQVRMSNIEEGMKRLYNVVYGQCSTLMIQRLRAIENFCTMLKVQALI